MTSPTQRSLKRLRDLGYLAAIVEHWNPHARVRQDLFGVFDLLGLKATETGLLAVQATSGPNVSTRVKKLLEARATLLWVKAGHRAQVWGWFKKEKHWHLRQISIKWAEQRGLHAVTDLPQDPVRSRSLPGPGTHPQGGAAL